MFTSQCLLTINITVFIAIHSVYPLDTEILAWCPVGLVLQRESFYLALVGQPHYHLLIKIPSEVDVLLHQHVFL